MEVVLALISTRLVVVVEEEVAAAATSSSSSTPSLRLKLRRRQRWRVIAGVRLNRITAASTEKRRRIHHCFKRQ